MKDNEGLRQRTQTPSSEPNKNNPSASSEAPEQQQQQQPMAGHRRGPVLAYSRGGTVATSRQTLSNYKNKIFIALGATILYTAFLYRSGGARSFLGGMKSVVTTRRLTIATWNVAAINNNVFEYWLTIPEEKAYEKLMVDVEQFIENPGEKDVEVSKVFTPAMFEQLEERFKTVKWDSMRTYWENDFSKRKIIGGFLKDPTLGSKRLASMPDRYTNLINTADGKVVFRPTIISMYEGDLGTQEKWWSAWQKFMFDTKLRIDKEEQTILSMLKPIKKSKYPAITEQEEKDSLPLQTMCAAIFDAILVHMMNTVSEPDVWQPLKRKIVDSLAKKKVENTLKILWEKYMDADIITLQEVSLAMIEQARKSKLGDDYVIVAPKELDSIRDQNSVILLKKTTFPHGSLGEITAEVEKAFPPKAQVPVAAGDINAIKTVDADGVSYVIASFHGDTNGLATKPVLDAIMKAMKDDRKLRNHRLIFGLDANTYEKGIPGKTQDVTEWGTHYTSYGLTSCWGDRPDPKNYTTYNARTFLQPQLNKACRKDEACDKADINPKDFILFPKADYNVIHTWKDNTGEKKYAENTAFPTLNFPSDHGILATVIGPNVVE
mmetsp:Transcript_9249/g.17683  ORF Transcript_9249/g.17683 Transcript_9249/m.17683 type:complete len:605 (-) Transcript_9249:49-1863(-)